MSKEKQIRTLKHYIRRINSELEDYEDMKSEALDKKTLYVEQLRKLEEEIIEQAKRTTIKEKPRIP